MSDQVKDIALNPDDGIEAQIAKALQPYKQQLAAEQQKAAQLQKLAAEKDAAIRKAQGDAQNAGIYAKQTEHLAVANKLAENEAIVASLNAKLALAVETADGKAVAEITNQLSELGPQRVMLKQGAERLKEEIEYDTRRAEEAAKRPPPPRQLSVDERINQLTPVQRDFLLKYKDRYLDANGNPTQQLKDAYAAAQAEGYRDDSPKLIAHMEQVLGHTQQHDGGQQLEDASARFRAEPTPAPQQQRQPAAQQQRRPPVSAPPSRSAGGGAPRGNAPRLTPAEEHAAARMGMTADEYRDGIRKGIERGKYPATYLNR